MVHSLWKTVWWFLKKFKIELPYDSAVPFLHICPKELKSVSQRYICPPMFIVTLFTAAKILVCVCVCVCIKECYSCVRKQEILPFVIMWIDL